jgi:sigma-B regulation protein RsbU (phosphoserine phosphatase)
LGKAVKQVLIAGNPSVQATTSPKAQETVLVVDDSRLQRRILSSYLNGWGYRVIEAGSGEAALALCQFECPDLIISDWMMPGMGGLEFCQAFRRMRGDRYGYFILLTSKSEKNEVAHGLDVGADDFLTKPVNAAELRARIRAGQRVLDMERELTEKNRLVGSTLSEMQALYAVIDRDLIEARKLQQSLVRDKFRKFDGLDVSLWLHPAGHVGGDLVGLFVVNDDEIGVYSIDVSGHGIASALMTARLAAYFSGNAPGQNIAIRQGVDGPGMRDPADVARHLNAMILNDMDTEHYLTLLLARVELSTRRVSMVQAGHPHPAVQKSDGTIQFVGQGGHPVGLIPDARFQSIDLELDPGSRLFLGSDGITECANRSGEMLEEAGLERLMRANAALTGEAFFEAIQWDLAAFSEGEDFADDVSGVLLDFRTPDQSNR